MAYRNGRSGPPHPHPDSEETLDAQVRRRDPDRWLATRFVSDLEARAAMVAVYALDQALAQIGPSVSQPMIGEIRLAWWRERIEAIAAGEPPPGEPVLHALAPLVVSGRASPAMLLAMVEARLADVEAAPFADDAALARYLDGASGAAMALATQALDAKAPLRAVVEAGRAWGLASLYRARSAWAAAGRRWTPTSWGDPGEAALAARVRAEVADALGRARVELVALPVRAFPAVAYVTLARAYAGGRSVGELGRRLRLVRAVAFGRV